MTLPVDEDDTEFLNVDLEVFSRERLAPLVKGLGRSVHVLHEGQWGHKYAACLELWASGSGQPAEGIIRRMVRLVAKMPRTARLQWNRAQVRQFNIGIQAALKPRSFELHLRPETLRAITQVGASVVVTVYAAESPLSTATTEARNASEPPNNRMQLTRSARGEAGSRRPRS